MEIKQIEDRKTEVVTDVICDCCGNSCMVNEIVIDNDVRIDNGEKSKAFEYMTLSANWGYFSKKDIEYWEAHVCEKCVDEKFGFVKFKVSETFFGNK